MTTSILLADSHQLVREALRRILDDQVGYEVVAEASDGAQAVARASERRSRAVSRSGDPRPTSKHKRVHS